MLVVYFEEQKLLFLMWLQHQSFLSLLFCELDITSLSSSNVKGLHQTSVNAPAADVRVF